jgi:hypothetical protein
MADRYPGYDVLDKWSSPSFDTLTRGVVRDRLHRPPPRRFFDEAQWALVAALAARLAPTPLRGEPVPIVAWIDAMLHEGRGEGFRAEGAPPLCEAWRRGLAGIAAESAGRHGRPFAELEPEAQDALLRAIQSGEVDEARWSGLDARRFFTDTLLKTVVGVYYSHPAAWSETGFGGPASPRGYVRIGLDERDPWEAEEEEAAG